MKAAAIFALAALVPAAFGAGPASARTLNARLCGAQGAARTVSIPLDPLAPLRGGDTAPCCAKGCHAGGSRKRDFRAG